jgi:hypothetical protein
MKSAMLIPGGIVLGFCLLSSCNNNKTSTVSGNPVDSTLPATIKNDTTSQAPEKSQKVITTTANQQDYKYDPSVSVITGTIITEMFYGPPGYGENPKTDKQEHPYLLKLETPVNVISASGKTDEDEDNPTVNNISKIQLIWPDGIDMEKLINKPVRLTGTFFHAHTGHHHTDILMDVEKLEEL